MAKERCEDEFEFDRPASGSWEESRLHVMTELGRLARGQHALRNDMTAIIGKLSEKLDEIKILMAQMVTWRNEQIENKRLGIGYIILIICAVLSPMIAAVIAYRSK